MHYFSTQLEVTTLNLSLPHARPSLYRKAATILPSLVATLVSSTSTIASTLILIVTTNTVSSGLRGGWWVGWVWSGSRSGRRCGCRSLRRGKVAFAFECRRNVCRRRSGKRSKTWRNGSSRGAWRLGFFGRWLAKLPAPEGLTLLGTLAGKYPQLSAGSTWH